MSMVTKEEMECLEDALNELNDLLENNNLIIDSHELGLYDRSSNRLIEKWTLHNKVAE